MSLVTAVLLLIGVMLAMINGVVFAADRLTAAMEPKRSPGVRSPAMVGVTRV